MINYSITIHSVNTNLLADAEFYLVACRSVLANHNNRAIKPLK